MQQDITAEFGPNGQYGIDALESVFETGNAIFDGYAAVYADDGKINADDLPDAFRIGPPLYAAVSKLASKASMLDEQVTDLSEGEKARLVDIAGDRIESPGYRKIIRGLLEVVDGASEIGKPRQPGRLTVGNHTRTEGARTMLARAFFRTLPLAVGELPF